MLPAGSGQTLTVTFTPNDTIDYGTVTTSVTIDVLPQSSPSSQTSTPTPAIIIGEQPVFRRKVRKNGHPYGKPVLVGFARELNTALAASAASNPANYELSTVAKKGRTRVLRPVRGFGASYSPGSDSVTIDLAGSPSFATGGRLAVLPGVADGSGRVLTGTTVSSITKGAKRLVPS